MSDNESGEEGEKIQVKFVTKIDDPKYQPPDTAFYIPISLARYGLSEIVNHILELEKREAFDFIVTSPVTTDTGKFLRTTIEKFTKKHGISYEDTLVELEYLIALEAPKPKAECEHDDWVSSVASPIGSKDNLYCVSGSYDGLVKFWVPSTEGQYVASATLSAHSKPIKAIALFNYNHKSTNLLTASQDYSIKWWKMKNIDKPVKNKFLSPRQHTEVGTFTHESPVESISVCPTNDKFISGSFDGTMLLWELTETATKFRPENNDDDEPAAKKAKKELARLEVLRVKEHVGCVSGLQWYEESKCISGSWDHSIRIWDFPTGVCTQKLHGGTSIYAISYQPTTHLILSGHADRAIRMWDARSSQVSVDQFKSHKAWVSSVQWHPTNSFLFASGSHDGTVKLWDTRSHIPLHNLPSHDPKTLCISWFDSQTIVSGGSDAKLKIQQFNNPIADGK